MSVIARYFRFDERSTDARTEVIAGVTTFMTMAYILFVNPAILGLGGEGLPFPAVLTVTAVGAGVMTIAMGLVSNYPFAIAAGLGLNAVVAFELVAAQGLSFAEAMGVVVVEGVLITVLVLTGFREAVLDAIPLDLKKAIGAGIGLFITLIGFQNSGLVVQGEGTLLDFGEINSVRLTVFVIGLAVTAVLVARRVRGSLLYGIVLTTVVAVVWNAVAGGGLWADVGPGVAQLPNDVVAAPDFSLVGQVDFGFFLEMGILAAVLAVFSLMLADFFDTMGTAVALGNEGGFLDADGRLPGMDRVLLVDSVAAAVGGALSASSNTTYIESASGIEEGGRTGFTSVVTGVLFLLMIFLSPIAGVIPPEATAPALILVGFLMISVARDIPWNDYAIGIPAFLTMVSMPFSFSITDGIGIGFIAYAVVMLATGRVRQVHWMMGLSSALFLFYFAIGPVQRLAGIG